MISNKKKSKDEVLQQNDFRSYLVVLAPGKTEQRKKRTLIKNRKRGQIFVVEFNILKNAVVFRPLLKSLMCIRLLQNKTYEDTFRPKTSQLTENCQATGDKILYTQQMFFLSEHKLRPKGTRIFERIVRLLWENFLDLSMAETGILD